MGILNNTVVYLAGQIENSNSASEWRQQLALCLHNINQTITVWDPLVKPPWVGDVANNKMAFEWKQYVLNNDSHSTKEMGRRCLEVNASVRRICKQLANKCDWMIARISSEFTWGSIDELEIAIARRIPVFLWLPSGLISIYGMAGCIHDYDHIKHYVHDGIHSLLNAIDDVDKRRIDLSGSDPETWMRVTWKNAIGD